MLTMYLLMSYQAEFLRPALPQAQPQAPSQVAAECRPLFQVMSQVSVLVQAQEVTVLTMYLLMSYQAESLRPALPQAQPQAPSQVAAECRPLFQVMSQVSVLVQA